jgi:hypothetical protein
MATIQTINIRVICDWLLGNASLRERAIKDGEVTVSIAELKQLLGEKMPPQLLVFGEETIAYRLWNRGDEKGDISVICDTLCFFRDDEDDLVKLFDARGESQLIVTGNILGFDYTAHQIDRSGYQTVAVEIINPKKKAAPEKKHLTIPLRVARETAEKLKNNNYNEPIFGRGLVEASHVGYRPRNTIPLEKAFQVGDSFRVLRYEGRGPKNPFAPEGKKRYAIKRLNGHQEYGDEIKIYGNYYLDQTVDLAGIPADLTVISCETSKIGSTAKDRNGQAKELVVFKFGLASVSAARVS